MRNIFSRFLLPHCYSQRALVFVPRNLPCLISRAWVQCLLLRSSHLYLNQRPAKTTISTREGSGVAQRRNRRASLSTRTASCRCRPLCVRFEISSNRRDVGKVVALPRYFFPLFFYTNLRGPAISYARWQRLQPRRGRSVWAQERKCKERSFRLCLGATGFRGMAGYGTAALGAKPPFVRKQDLVVDSE
jgi:hypothetical protein